MKEEILTILTQLFAILSKHGENRSSNKQEYITHFLKGKIEPKKIPDFVNLYVKKQQNDDIQEKTTFNEYESIKTRNQKISDVKDAIELLTICKDINTKLNLKQKTMLVMDMLEYLAFHKNYTDKQIKLIQTASNALNIPNRTFSVLEFFILLIEFPENDIPELVEITNTYDSAPSHQSIFIDGLDGHCFFLHLKEINTFLFRMFGNNKITINGERVARKVIYLFTEGSELKFENEDQIFYSDLIRTTTNTADIEPILFEVKNVSYSFENTSNFSHQKINIKETEGKIIGIMGASGSGKTTLINLFSGNISPTIGSVTINGIDIHKSCEQIEGVIGYIGQDDILIENLTVYENLFYNTQLCFKHKTTEEISKLVTDMLNSLELSRVAGLKVGNVLNKTISGGQRKRLNIALELIREPHVLFVDEPTSGLSSQDSKNVMRLLKELTVKGKLIFTVIHQPSSEIFQSFDKILILDIGSIPVYYGNPVDSVNYFQSHDNRFYAENSQTSITGNSNPEQIFEILESKKINEFGKETNLRRRTPKEWNEVFQSTNNTTTEEEESLLKDKSIYSKKPKSNLHLPTKIKQALIFIERDLLSKWNNTQYMLLNLLEAPILAFVLAILLRHKNNQDNTAYVYGLNENIPAFILVSVIVALFMGLSISAQEILKDEKLRKREQFLNLSRHSYLLSKLVVLFILSAIQTSSFVLITHNILKIEGMFLQYWIMLFSSACCANLIGLNISNSFKNITTVYISIPLILIPQLILSGALFDFEKLNQTISEHGKTPLVSDIMVSRWAYEGLAVWQDKENQYNQKVYAIDKEVSLVNYYKNYWLTELDKIKTNKELSFYLERELTNYNHQFKQNVTLDNWDIIKPFLTERMHLYSNAKNRLIQKLQESQSFNLLDQKEKYVNNRLHYVVKHLNAEHRVLSTENGLVQNMDAIYQEASTLNKLSWRAPLYIAYKNLFGYKTHTYWFNLLVIWVFSFMLYYILFLNVFKRIITFIKNKK